MTKMEKMMWGEYPASHAGAFSVQSKQDGGYMHVIATSGEGWDHISVSRADRVPDYYEMKYIAELFLKSGEVAMQLYVPSKDHVNIHNNCLHWFRPTKKEIPLPPKEFV